MAKTRSMTRTHNHDDDGASFSAKRPKTCAPWSDLDHDLLFLVMMQLGVVDFVSLSGVCKSWRSLALSNRDTFMASTPPMSITINGFYADEKECYLEDFEGRKFKTILPDFTGGSCIGLTCGYLVFYMRETRDLRLVNPITRHQLHFPAYPAGYHPDKAILVFSASISQWVFVVFFKYFYEIWFCIAGKGAWNRVSYPRAHIMDVSPFKGKIYTLISDIPYQLCELRLGGPQPEFMPLQAKQPECTSVDVLVSSGDNFYGIRWDQYYNQKSLHELDLGEMKWVKVGEKTLEEYAFFRSLVNDDVVAVKRESWADPRSRSHGRYAYTPNNGNIRFITASMWYFPHECLNVDL